MKNTGIRLTGKKLYPDTLRYNYPELKQYAREYAIHPEFGVGIGIAIAFFDLVPLHCSLLFTKQSQSLL